LGEAGEEILVDLRKIISSCLLVASLVLGSFAIGSGMKGCNVPLPPGPNPTPNPTDLTDFAKAIKTAADGATGDPNRSDTARKLATIYRDVADGGSVDITSLAGIASAKVDQLMQLQGPSAAIAWRPTRDVIGAKFNAAAQEGATVASLSALMKEAATGLDASASKPTWH
jgi:hypothetical protein